MEEQIPGDHNTKSGHTKDEEMEVEDNFKLEISSDDSEMKGEKESAGSIDIIEQANAKKMSPNDTGTNGSKRIHTKTEESEAYSDIEVKPEPQFTTSPDKIISFKTLGPYIASKDNALNTIYFSDIPDICKQQPCMLGVDEAGRGPVLGPMVYGIAYCPLDSKQVLIDLQCADSKGLTEQKRDTIFDQLHTVEKARCSVGWAVELVAPNVISNCMNRRTKCSLNEISMNSAIGLIQRAVDEGVNIAEVYVDTVGPPEKYQEKLKRIFPQFDITVAKKADATYPIVSAASICAKVTRDHALQVWRFPEKLPLTAKDYGSGYPSDPVTKRFLDEHISDLLFGYPRLVRFSWATAENALAYKSYTLEFDAPDSEKPKYAGRKLTTFFKGATKGGVVKRERCRFLRERFLDNVIDF